MGLLGTFGGRHISVVDMMRCAFLLGRCPEWFLFLLAVVFAVPCAAEEPPLWQSGKNQYVLLVVQDDSLDDTPPNSHPVELDPEPLRLALGQLQVQEEGWLSGTDSYPVFSEAQRRILAQVVAEGLAKAGPDQEIIFALAGKRGNPEGRFSFGGSVYTAGRVFYLDDRLHIIFGDFRRPRDKGKEAMAGQFGEYEVSYRLQSGRRAGPRGMYAMKQALVPTKGLENQSLEGKQRPDWLLVDIQTAAGQARAAARQRSLQTPAGQALQKADQAARERFELRVEMARMRKELRSLSEGASGNDKERHIRQRITTLERLRREGLINEEEYQKKRSEIISEL